MYGIGIAISALGKNRYCCIFNKNKGLKVLCKTAN